MKYDDLSTQSSDKHMFNCFSGSGPHGEAESTGTAQPGEEKLWRDFINVYKYLMEEIKWWSWTFLSSVQGEDQTQWASTENSV